MTRNFGIIDVGGCDFGDAGCKAYRNCYHFFEVSFKICYEPDDEATPGYDPDTTKWWIHGTGLGGPPSTPYIRKHCECMTQAEADAAGFVAGIDFRVQGNCMYWVGYEMKRKCPNCKKEPPLTPKCKCDCDDLITPRGNVYDGYTGDAKVDVTGGNLTAFAVGWMIINEERFYECDCN